MYRDQTSACAAIWSMIVSLESQGDARCAPHTPNLPLKGGGRRAKRGGWGSIRAYRSDPHPTSPFKRAFTPVFDGPGGGAHRVRGSMTSRSAGDVRHCDVE